MSGNGSILPASELLVASSPPAERCERFRIEVIPNRDTVRVAPIGELDLSVAGSLKCQLEELHAAGFRRFVLDLRRLSFIDSSGLAVIVGWNKYAAEQGMSFELIRGPRAVHRVFDLVGLTDRLSFRHQ